MLKRFGISFCILLAFILLQAHSFVVHHHGAPKEVTQGHAHDGTTHHHHHGSPAQKDSGSANKEADASHEDHSPFSDVSHTAEFGKVLIRDEGMSLFFDSKPIIGLPAVPVYLNNTIYNPLFRARPPDKGSIVHLIFISHSLPARPPPSYALLS